MLDYVKEVWSFQNFMHALVNWTFLQMNRPFGAGMSNLFLPCFLIHLKFEQADIFANLKGAVAKTSVQKILVALAEKGEITQKAYGE